MSGVVGAIVMLELATVRVVVGAIAMLELAATATVVTKRKHLQWFVT